MRCRGRASNMDNVIHHSFLHSRSCWLTCLPLNWRIQKCHTTCSYVRQQSESHRDRWLSPWLQRQQQWVQFSLPFPAHLQWEVAVTVTVFPYFSLVLSWSCDPTSSYMSQANVLTCVFTQNWFLYFLPTIDWFPAIPPIISLWPDWRKILSSWLWNFYHTRSCNMKSFITSTSENITEYSLLITQSDY